MSKSKPGFANEEVPSTAWTKLHTKRSAWATRKEEPGAKWLDRLTKGELEPLARGSARASHLQLGGEG